MSASSAIDPTLAVADVNNTALPPGRTWGQRCVVSPACLSRVVSGWGDPPAEETLNKGAPTPGVNTIVPAPPQLPPRSLGAWQSVTGAPPCTEIFFSLRSARARVHLPSGEETA